MVEKSFLDVLRLLLPVSRSKRESLNRVSVYLSGSDYKDFKYLFKMGKVIVSDASMGSKHLGAEASYPLIERNIEDPGVIDLVESWNASIIDVVGEALFQEFAPKSDVIKSLIAPNIVGMDEVKEGVLLQLFADEKVHILLLGDPGTGKTEILSAIADLAYWNVWSW